MDEITAMKKALLQNEIDMMYSQNTRYDPFARIAAFIALFLALIAVIGSLGLTPWIYMQSSHSTESSKANMETITRLQEQVNILQNTVTQLTVAMATGHNTKQRGNQQSELFFNSTSNISRTRSKRQAQKDEPDAPAVDIGSEYGATTYVRWGRSQCRNGAVTIYSGVAAGGFSGHTGGGASYQCLPNEPEFDYVNPGWQYSTGIGGSAIYGVEFKLGNIDPFDNKFNKGKSLNLEDSTCSRCLVNGKSTSLMIPAKTQCPEGWTEEYRGYLMAPHYKQHRMSYVCVDRAPEPRNAGESTNGGVYWYPVEISCGAIPCPKYDNGQEVACVVCTL